MAMTSPTEYDDDELLPQEKDPSPTLLKSAESSPVLPLLTLEEDEPVDNVIGSDEQGVHQQDNGLASASEWLQVDLELVSLTTKEQEDVFQAISVVANGDSELALGCMEFIKGARETLIRPRNYGIDQACGPRIISATRVGWYVGD